MKTKEEWNDFYKVNLAVCVAFMYTLFCIITLPTVFMMSIILISAMLYLFAGVYGYMKSIGYVFINKPDVIQVSETGPK